MNGNVAPMHTHHGKMAAGLSPLDTVLGRSNATPGGDEDDDKERKEGK